MMSRKVAAHLVGAGASISTGAAFAHYVDPPFGLPSLPFYTVALVAGYSGYEFGRQLGHGRLRIAFVVTFALLVVPAALYLYEVVRHISAPSPVNSALIFLLYASAVFSLTTALGILELRLET